MNIDLDATLYIERVHPTVIDVDGVKYIKVSEHNKRIFLRHWDGERFQLSRIANQLLYQIDKQKEFFGKEALSDFRDIIVESLNELERRSDLAHETGNVSPQRKARTV